MKKYWSTEELQEFWKLLPEEKEQIEVEAQPKRLPYVPTEEEL
jgi:hypothetical protein